ncbi:MAG: hypothetical protein NC318_11400 [Blautia sp.]|nr:hypothetical protein [Lachnoclostridium sp.]MCM1212198.1 hypothetical protein [Blautia sp.]
MAKVIAGTCLCLFVCTLYMRIRLCSVIMRYMGKRSLFFYLIHLGLRRLVGGIEGINGEAAFYIVLIATFAVVELFFQIYQRAARHV